MRNRVFASMMIFALSGMVAWAGDAATNEGADAPARQAARGGGGYTDYTDYASFLNASADLVCVDFTGMAAGTVLSNQYANELGVFVDGNDIIHHSSSFDQDGEGINGQGRISIDLANPSRAIGCFFPGALTIEVYDRRGGRLLYTSQDFAGSGTGFFGGVVSDGETFQYVVLRDWFDDLVFIDDICVDADDEVCPVEFLLAGQPNNVPQLRRFRDEFVAVTPEGREAVKAYYAVSPEMVVRLALDSQARSDALSLLKTFQPAVANMLGEKGGHPVKLTDARLAQVDRVTQRLVRTGSPRLRETVTKLNKKLQAHKNRSFAEFCHAIVDEGI